MEKKWKIEFVDLIPSTLENNVFYICIKCDVVVHLCACGCNNKVVTPIDKHFGWILNYDGESISLFPSIGNYNFECKSHYYVKNSKIVWLEESNISSNILSKAKVLLKKLVRK